MLLLQVEATPAWHLKVALPETVAESFTSRNREENGETRASSGLSGSQGNSLKYSKFCCLRKRLVKLLGRAARGFRTSIPAARSCRTDYPASRIKGPAETNLHEDWTSYITCYSTFLHLHGDGFIKNAWQSDLSQLPSLLANGNCGLQTAVRLVQYVQNPEAGTATSNSPSSTPCLRWVCRRRALQLLGRKLHDGLIGEAA